MAAGIAKCFLWVNGAADGIGLLDGNKIYGGQPSLVSSRPMQSRRLGWCARCACPIFPIMKRTTLMLNGCLTVAAVIASGKLAFADAKVNPYESIVERNPFALKPPPPPAPPEDPSAKTPPVPPATVELTGITSILKSKKALLEIIPGPGKPTLKHIMSEGERIESVEVVSIDIEKNEVTIKNGTLMTNLTFKVAKSSDKPATPPGLPPPTPGIPGVPPPASAGVPGAVPPAYGNQESSGGRGVQVGGGVPAADGFRSIPPRGIRSNAGQVGQPQQQMTAEESILDLETKRTLIDQARSAGARIPPLPSAFGTPPQGDGGDPGNVAQPAPMRRPGWVPPKLPQLPAFPGQQPQQ